MQSVGEHHALTYEPEPNRAVRNSIGVTITPRFYCLWKTRESKTDGTHSAKQHEKLSHLQLTLEPVRRIELPPLDYETSVLPLTPNRPVWSGRESNPQPPGCDPGALPIELPPHSFLSEFFVSQNPVKCKPNRSDFINVIVHHVLD